MERKTQSSISGFLVGDSASYIKSYKKHML